MELLILNTELESVDILDNFESLIWTERYCGYGDFEIYTKVSPEIFTILRPDSYVWIKDSKQVMIIEGFQIKFDAETGAHLIITGRSAETLLDRRIIWAQTVLSGNLQNGIQKLLNENIIAPTITDRAIPNFTFQASNDSVVTALEVEAQYTRTNLYDSIKNLCAVNDIGFQVRLSETNQFVFELYSGTDRSYDQFVNPYVIFSQKFDNLINSNYSESQKALKTVTVVCGEGEGVGRKTTIVGSGVSLVRRELYTDARDLSQTVDSVLIPEVDYIAQLAQRGIENLSENISQRTFDGQVDTTRMFKYGEDFFLGDIVQIVSEYGIEAKARVIEVIRSQSTSGIDVYPTFTMLD